MYTIGQLAKRFGLSRSTLLYYDAIGLLPASTRSASGYRLYTEQAVQRMTHIQTFRDAGLPLETIRTLLASGTDAPTAVLERHLQELNSDSSPEAHQDLLESRGIDEVEIALIRQHSRCQAVT